MAITINGTGTITGISAGGLPDASVTLPDLAASVASGVAKAWVNFNGSGTVAIRASLNVSSITDNGVGDYSANFTTALTNANGAFSISTVNTASANSNNNSIGLRAPTTAFIGAASLTTSSVRVSSRTSSGNQSDPDAVSVILY